MADVTNNKQYIDLVYLKEFWKRIKALPTTSGEKYTVTLPTGKEAGVWATNPDTIVGHLGTLYSLIADEQGKSYNVSQGTGISVTGTGTDKDPWVISIDATWKASVDAAIAKIDAWKGQTTFTAGSNKDLSKGNVVLTLGGDGAASGQTVTLSKIDISALENVLHVGDAEISGSDTITLTATNQSGTATINGENGSSATVGVDASAIFTAISDAEGKIEKLDKSNVESTGGSYVTATTTAKTSTSGGELTMTIDDSALDTTFLKKADANNSVISINNVTLEKASTGTLYSGTMTYTDNAGAPKSATISFDSAEFVKDSFLQDAKMGSGAKANYLILTMKLAEPDAQGKDTKDIEIDLSKFIDAYTAANKSIDITNNAIKVNLDGGYLKLNTNGIGVDTSKIQGYASTEAKTGDNKLASKKYVDDTAKAAEDAAKAAVTGGTSTANLITVTTAATTAAPTVSATLASSTATATAIATKEYVDEKITGAEVGYASTTLNISEATTSGKKTVTINAPIATWSDDDADDDFPFGTDAN